VRQQTEILIVGGGVWGLSAAYHLAHFGQKRVRLLERNKALADETTPQAAGLVGQIRATPTMMRAIQYALTLFSQFPEEVGFKQSGSLMVALTPKRMSAYARNIEKARQNGIEAHFVPESAMVRLAPGLDAAKVEGAYFVPHDGYLNPRACALAYADKARANGVVFQTETPVLELIVRNSRAVGVETPQGFIESDRVIITAGPWTRLLAKKMGFDLPAQPIRHQRVRTAPTDGIPTHHPVARIPDVSCYVRPEQGGYLYGFFEPNPVNVNLASKAHDFRTADIEPPLDVMDTAQSRLSPYFPALETLAVVERNQGITTFAPDGAYLLGPVPGVDGLFVATGCAALGIAGSAAVGKWLAQWVTHGNPDDDLAAFAPNRFGGRATDETWVEREAKKCYAHYYSIRLE